MSEGTKYPRGRNPNSLANLKRGRKPYAKNDGRIEERIRGGHNSNENIKWDRKAKALVADMLSAEVTDKKLLALLEQFGLKGEKAVYFAATVAQAIRAAIGRGDVNAIEKLAQMAGFFESDDDGNKPEINIIISEATPKDVEEK